MSIGENQTRGMKCHQEISARADGRVVLRLETQTGATVVDMHPEAAEELAANLLKAAKAARSMTEETS